MASLAELQGTKLGNSRQTWHTKLATLPPHLVPNNPQSWQLLSNYGNKVGNDKVGKPTLAELQGTKLATLIELMGTKLASTKLVSLAELRAQSWPRQSWQLSSDLGHKVGNLKVGKPTHAELHGTKLATFIELMGTKLASTKLVISPNFGHKVGHDKVGNSRRTSGIKLATLPAIIGAIIGNSELGLVESTCIPTVARGRLPANLASAWPRLVRSTCAWCGLAHAQLCMSGLLRRESVILASAPLPFGCYGHCAIRTWCGTISSIGPGPILLSQSALCRRHLHALGQ